MQKLNLAGSWEFREKGRGNWETGKVPGSLFKDLLQADRIPDPFYRDNSDEIKKLAEKNYVYRRTFTVDEKLLACDRIFLSCQGLDTLAGIFLNGTKIAKTANMHRHYEFEISDHISSGKNTIRIEFYSSLEYIARCQAEDPVFGVDHTVPGYPHLRKAHYMLGWDWGPVLPDLGIWREIEIIGYENARLNEVYPRQEHHLSENRVELKVSIGVDLWPESKKPQSDESKGSSNFKLLANLSGPEGEEWKREVVLSKEYDSFSSSRADLECNLPDDDDAKYKPDCCRDFWQKYTDYQKIPRRDSYSRKVTLDFQLEDPRLWWPAEWGGQPLYQLTVKLLKIKENHEKNESRSECMEKEIDCWQQRLGMREIELVRETDEWGESFYFKINDRDIFIRGANYIPEDNLLSRTTKKETAALIRDCLRANFNMIRVWGGGIYPPDYFYDICDEEGMLVWQDLMFACSGYRLSDSFAASITAEIRDNVCRIRHHPSLAIWCGNNEIEWGMKEWGIEEEYPEHRVDYVKQFETLIPALVHELDPQNFFWPSSPSSGGGYIEPNSQDKGNVHYWEVWHGLKPFDQYRNIQPRFITEFGLQSFPEFRTVKSFTEAEDRNIFSRIMEHHQRNPGGNSRIVHYLGEYFKFPDDFASLLYLSQLIQAEGLKTGIEHFRRLRGRCMGTIYWQLNDCWPGASWSSRDYFGRWKALHYFARRFYSAILLTAEEASAPDSREEKMASKIEDNSYYSSMAFNLHLANDTLSTVRGEINWFLETSTGETLEKGQFNVELPQRKAQQIKCLDFSDYRAKQREIYLRAEFNRQDMGPRPFNQNLKSQNPGIENAGSTAYQLFVRPKHFKLLPPGLSCKLLTGGSEREKFKLEITAENLAKYIKIELPTEDYQPADNYFHLAGGERRVIPLEKSAGMGKNSRATGHSTAAEEKENEEARIKYLSENIRLFSLYDSFEKA